MRRIARVLRLLVPGGAPARCLAGTFGLLVACTVTPEAAAQEVTLHTGWRIQSSAKVEASGAALSRAEYVADGWSPATVPSTVVGALVEDGLYGDPYVGMNLRKIPGTTYPIGDNFSHDPMPESSPFAVPWWYRTTFRLPASMRGQHVALHFDGINYRANIWLNGKRLADSAEVAGTYRRYEFDITDAVRATGDNALAVEVFAPTPADLALTWVDWNPMPPDKDMGLWHEVRLTASGDVAIRDPFVTSVVDTATLERAELTVAADVRNATSHAVEGTLSGRIEGITFSQPVTLAPHDTATVRFTPERFPQLRVEHPRLWWPAALGKPELYRLELTFTAGDAVTDRSITPFGIRQITSERTPGDARLFRVNGRRILIRGGGWAPDMMLRPEPERQAAQLEYVRDLGLNTVRLEGKLEDDRFWHVADSTGVLIMAGWCCCSAWEQWSKWGPEQYRVAAASERDQIRRLRGHPAALVWLYGSDNPPPADVETMYRRILQAEGWPNPSISSASATPTTVTGSSGVKMTGPYDWVPPIYWFADTAHGGGWGYNTETSPGAAVPPIESIRKMIPPDHIWPIDSVWNFHSASGRFKTIDAFTNTLAARYGAPTGAEDYTRKAQLMTYEGQRAMYEAYRRNAYVSTGIIQWMLNDSWPSLFWHLYDWYLRPGGGYFGSKKANEPVHVMYSYDDRSVVVVNGTHTAMPRVRLRARVLGLDGAEKLARDTAVDVPPDSSVRVFVLGEPADLAAPTYFVDLRLSAEDGSALSTNLYWLSTKPDVLDEAKSTWWYTPVSSYADYTALAAMPPAQVKATVRFSRQGTGPDAREVAHVLLTNPGKTLAFFVRLQLTKGPGGEEALPVLWEDNYVTLLPGETRVVTGSARVRDLGGAEAALRVEGWNVGAGEALKARR